MGSPAGLSTEVGGLSTEDLNNKYPRYTPESSIDANLLSAGTPIRNTSTDSAISLEAFSLPVFLWFGHSLRITPPKRKKKMTDSARSATPRRIHQIVKLKPEHYEEYKRCHQAVWPEVLQQIKASHIEDCKSFILSQALSLEFIERQRARPHFQGPYWLHH